MDLLHRLKLKKGKEQNLWRKHPWVFSGALQSATSALTDGDLVQVLDHQGQPLGFGHFHHGSIAIKMLGFSTESYDAGFWERKLQAALQWRLRLLSQLNQTDCFRWVHGEGDGLPGLIIDVYHDTVVIQCHTIGMHRMLPEIQAACQVCMVNNPIHIVDKSRNVLPPAYGKNVQDRLLQGEAQVVKCLENGIQFEVDPIGGQKTGFFLDQGENRKLLRRYSADEMVLNAFSYTGGFSLAALAGGAHHVYSVDISQKAIDGCIQNVQLNQFPSEKHTAICADVLDYLKDIPSDQFGIIVLDPPAFAKSLNKRHQAVQAYKRLNLLAMKKIKKGGLLFTFSCSQVVTEELFYHTIVSAGIESGRTFSVLQKLQQAPDHPVNLFHPEGAYLKGLMLKVD